MEGLFFILMGAIGEMGAVGQKQNRDNSKNYYPYYPHSPYQGRKPDYYKLLKQLTVVKTTHYYLLTTHFLKIKNTAKTRQAKPAI